MPQTTTWWSLYSVTRIDERQLFRQNQALALGNVFLQLGTSARALREG
jgi:hypothetical protein